MNVNQATNPIMALYIALLQYIIQEKGKGDLKTTIYNHYMNYPHNWQARYILSDAKEKMPH